MICKTQYGPQDSEEIEVPSREAFVDLLLESATFYVTENEDDALSELVETRNVEGIIQHLRVHYHAIVTLVY